MPDLFTPLRIGSIEAENRVFMAPMTRARSSKDGVPSEIMATYYSQRVSAGLIISEATGISRSGLGWPYAPGIWSEEQVEKWKPIVAAVHAKGGKIICQLCHEGRAVHSDVTSSQPVSASATSLPTEEIHTFDGKKPVQTAHPLTISEIEEIVDDYARAAQNAIDAGFDGVQLHAANGFLIDQFLRNSANLRTDKYGGSVENRVRFLDEIVTAVAGAIGADKVSVRLSPNGDSQGVIDSDPEPLFVAAGKVLEQRKVAMVELREGSSTTGFLSNTDQPQLHSAIRKVYSGVLVLNQDYDQDTANAAIESGVADAISFGRGYIANPTLVMKFKTGLPLAEADLAKAFMYSQDAEGYTSFA